MPEAARRRAGRVGGAVPMSLVVMLIALAVELRFDACDRYRNLGWFERYGNRLEARLGRFAFWDGAGGLLVALALPLALLGLAVHLAFAVHLALGLLLTLPALLYCLGPSLNVVVSNCISAVEAGAGDDLDLDAVATVLPAAATARGDADAVVGALLFKSHEGLFAVMFWFFVLGPVGALLYCLAADLAVRHENVRGGYADAVRDLHKLLMWPSARLLALGFAMSGSLVDGLAGWREAPGDSLAASRRVITAAGLGALRHSLDEAEDAGDARQVFIARLRETLGLVNRSLVVWLIVLGLLALGGLLG